MYVGIQAQYKDEYLVERKITMKKSYLKYKIINNVI